MCPGQLPCDAQPQASALAQLVLACLNLNEGLKQAPQIVLADAHAFVSDTDAVDQLLLAGVVCIVAN